MSGEDTEQLRQQIQQFTDELDAAYQQIANNTERITDLERRLLELEQRLEELPRERT